MSRDFLESEMERDIRAVAPTDMTMMNLSQSTVRTHEEKECRICATILRVGILGCV